MAQLQRCFFSYLGVHSFLIGLFPFYIPVYLFAHGFNMQQISIFIAITGLGFCISLYGWDRLHKRISLSILIVLSFVAEFIVLSLFILHKDLYFLFLTGLANGLFNACFWIIQRLLFLETITPENSGRKYGNFQIFVLVILKTGIFIGGMILDTNGFVWLYCISGIITLSASIFFLQNPFHIELNQNIVKIPPLSFKSIAAFNDTSSSRFIFIIDGVFLYFESYFWVLSLFLIVEQSFTKLGLLVIFLTLLFGVIYYFIKNSIDLVSGTKIYGSAVFLYCLSWILRGSLDEDLDKATILIMLALITFCTSFFRLAFNKRFFDLAKSGNGHEYIFIKSYISQFFIVIFFLLISTVFDYRPENIVSQLSNIYYIAAFCSLFYLIYRKSEVIQSNLVGNNITIHNGR